MAYDYFDEDYFQNGASKGTVYNNYLEVSRSSLIYREIAEAVARVFRPRRALEIGCATGVIVRYLNEMGVETHGIDVSEWAVSKREHPHVVLAGAEKLPFKDGHFDFIYSVHALEHIPKPLKSAAFMELRRVCGRGTQFHMMPIVGLGPYVGERDTVIAGLKKDPTHSLLDDRTWWLAEFDQIGFADVRAGLHFANEAGAIDLSESQVLVADHPLEAKVFDRIRTWNTNVLRSVVRRARQAEQGIYVPLADGLLPPALTLRLAGQWGDVELQPNGLPLKPGQSITAFVELLSEVPLPLRFCFIAEDGSEADLWREYRPGSTIFSFSAADLQQRKSTSGEASIGRVLFGGTGTAEIHVGIAVHT